MSRQKKKKRKKKGKKKITWNNKLFSVEGAEEGVGKGEGGTEEEENKLDN